jgi:hypothetical protein
MEQPMAISYNDHFDKLSLEFIREVKAIYGTDVANTAVTAISEAIGKEWSARLIMGIISDDSYEYMGIRVTCIPEEYQNASSIIPLYRYTNKINLIKELRGAAWIGLREAKDAIEDLENRVSLWMMTNGITPNAAKMRIKEAPFLDIRIDNQQQVKSDIDRKYQVIDALAQVGLVKV